MLSNPVSFELAAIPILYACVIRSKLFIGLELTNWCQIFIFYFAGNADGQQFKCQNVARFCTSDYLFYIFFHFCIKKQCTKGLSTIRIIQSPCLIKIN